MLRNAHEDTGLRIYFIPLNSKGLSCARRTQKVNYAETERAKERQAATLKKGDKMPVRELVPQREGEMPVTLLPKNSV